MAQIIAVRLSGLDIRGQVAVDIVDELCICGSPLEELPYFNFLRRCLPMYRSAYLAVQHRELQLVLQVLLLFSLPLRIRCCRET